jgi:predicted dehydrogenase
MRGVSFAMLGCSHPHSRWHLATLRLIPEVAAIWLWDADPAAAHALEAEAGERCRGSSSDLDALLKRAELDFVLIAARNDETPDLVRHAARAGKQILSEKPMAVSPEALLPALAAARDAGVSLAAHYPWRAHPIARDVRRMLAAGLFGRPVAVEARLATSQPQFRDPGHWLFDPAAAGGGVLAWLGCHVLDLLRYLLQDEIVEVCAITGALCEPGLRVEDSAALSLRFANGALGTFHAGYQLPRSAPGYQGATYDTVLRIRGTEGRCGWEPLSRAPVLELESTHRDWVGAAERQVRYALETSDAYGGRHGLEFVREFIRASQEGAPPPATGEDALAVLGILAAAYESARTGRRVAVRNGD